MNTLKKFLSPQLFIALLSVAMIFAFSISLSCASSKPSSAVAAESSGALSLDQAIHAAADQIDARVEARSKIALVKFSSPSDAFSTYVLDELSANLVESGRLMIIDMPSDIVLQDIDNPACSYNPDRGAGNFYACDEVECHLAFRGVRAARFSLTNNHGGQTSVFEEIILGDPDE